MPNKTVVRIVSADLLQVLAISKVEGQQLSLPLLPAKMNVKVLIVSSTGAVSVLEGKLNDKGNDILLKSAGQSTSFAATLKQVYKIDLKIID